MSTVDEVLHSLIISNFHLKKLDEIVFEWHEKAP